MPNPESEPPHPERPRPSPALLQLILRHLLPRPEVLPLVAHAFGPDNAVYDCLHNVILGQPPWVYDDIDRYIEFLEGFGHLFHDALELRPNIVHLLDPDFWDENNEPRY